MAGFSILQEAAIPFNGSGSFSLAEPAFVPNTTISSAAVNSDLQDIADGLSDCLTTDGQSTMSAQIKGFAGTVTVPGYSFSTDPNTGIYRVAADNIGVTAGGTKILDISTTGLAVTGALSATGTFTPSGGILFPDGTVLLPSIAFTNDPDCGVYRIGANNIGVSVNAAKVLDISTSGLNVVGTILQNGGALSPFSQGVLMVNGSIAESHTGNAVTFSIKTLAGTDPSPTDPVLFGFRDVTAATGNYAIVQVTAALSLTITSGSTVGFASATAGKLWLVAFNDGGTVRLGAINCRSGTNVYPLGGFGIASATAEGGAGGADSAQVFYAGTAVTSKAYSVLGYASYESGLATAGSWDVSPTRMQLMALGVKLPGDTIQIVNNSTTTVGSISSGSFAALTSGQTQSVTLVSAANVVRVRVSGTWGLNSASSTQYIQITKASTTPLGNPTFFTSSVGGSVLSPLMIEAYDTPSSSSPTYGLGGATNTGSYTYPSSGTGSLMVVEEIVA